MINMNKNTARILLIIDVLFVIYLVAYILINHDYTGIAEYDGGTLAGELIGAFAICGIPAFLLLRSVKSNPNTPQYTPIASICKNCGKTLKPADRFCDRCGYQLVQTNINFCMYCGTPLIKGATNCNNCGQKI
jgi:hypothetical protein